MQIQENFSLKPYNTFGIDAKARYFAPFSNAEQLAKLTTHQSPKKSPPEFPTESPTEPRTLRAFRAQLTTFILGGGSNILFTKDFDGLVLRNEVKGIEKIKEDSKNVYVRVGAGENWHRFVLHCIRNNWAGVENLSLIPGNVGASPMQNIGAYGVEIREVFHELTAFHRLEKTIHTFRLEDCEFGYRDSVFKNKYKDQFVIIEVTYRLNKSPKYNTSYGAIQQELDKMGVKELSIAAISQAVINIRTSKLPDPAVIGNAGSFFKNPSISKDKFQELRSKFQKIVGYENKDGSIKLAAAWLIEHSGPTDSVSWKGFRRGDAGCHQEQALVLVNFGRASGKEIYDLSEAIRQSVVDKFGVDLEREVNLI